jgi:hypothetical protein
MAGLEWLTYRHRASCSLLVVDIILAAGGGCCGWLSQFDQWHKCGWRWLMVLVSYGSRSNISFINGETIFCIFELYCSHCDC